MFTLRGWVSEWVSERVSFRTEDSEVHVLVSLSSLTLYARAEINPLFPKRQLTRYILCVYRFITTCVQIIFNGTNKITGIWFNIKIPTHHHRRAHYGDKTMIRSSYIQNGSSYTGRTVTLYCISPKPSVITIVLLVCFALERCCVYKINNCKRLRPRFLFIRNMGYLWHLSVMITMC